LTLDQHNPFEGEISFLGYAGEDHTVITCGWDRVIKVHMDEKSDHSLGPDQSKVQKAPATQRATTAKKSGSPGKGKKGTERVEKFYNAENLLRRRCEAHSKDIICGDFAPHLDMIATGGRDNKAKIWDYERINCIDEIQGDEIPESSNEITMVKFIKPFPLLLTSDSSGQVYIWITKPHPNHGTCLVNWRNNYTLKSNSPITAIDTFHDEKTGKFLLLIGDDMGTVRI
jgi:WD40 repeat protein